ncbi:flagellar hook-associated protein FlgK [Pseudomonas sp. NCCP-436]|uniref:flagellar hook-associated protein FlgK n=1 Tax=Pseudomonas sp. NCCP-436 TaxID=2842481 RepID=UPI001C7FCCCA|nr:flagellar hook-associated protein FlgK [Pseudomonas sp. NCCP-436]GIZ13830.1 flagellar hook-associated protein FlgK [Pseudomonas sp. NCCP-436]
MADLMSIGLSGLAASKTSLTVTGHNITNVNTPGYSRQDTSQAARVPQFSGAGYIGTGTSLTDIRRSYSEFLTTQVRSSTALSADVKSYLGQISQLDSLLAGSTTGITPSLQKFFGALQTAAEDPANIPARQLVLSEAEGLARRFNGLYASLSSQNEFTNKQMQVVTEQVNRLAGTVGQLNEAIGRASAAGGVPNDLLDARDEAVRQLSEYIGVTVVPQDDNTFNLFIGSGQPLVIGNSVSRVEAVPGRGDPTRFDIDFISGGSRQSITTQITGGELGGLLRYREEVLDASFNALGRLAMVIGEELNAQLGQGLDLKGDVGVNLFKDSNSSDLLGHRVRAFSDNISQVSGTLSIDNHRLLHASDYRLEYDGSTYRARRLSDNAEITVDASNFPELRFSDATGNDQGFSVTLSGAPFAGDRLLLQPTRNGSLDIAAVLDQPDQLALAAPLRSEAHIQNRGTGQIGQPTVLSVIDPANPPAGYPAGSYLSDALQQATVEAVGSLTMRYDEATGELVFQAPLPAGVSVTPAALSVTPGQNNTLSYELEVSVGGVTQSFRIEQSFSGRPQEGDTFSVGHNDKGVSDNRNALELVNLQTRELVGIRQGAAGLSGMNLTDAYGDLVERVGTLTAQARLDDDATSAILKQATDSRDSLSGVNLDEEAANLIKFQQYYQASAQIIQTARTLFDTLISSVR